MESGILGMGAVAWTEAWNSASPEPGLHLSVDPARLLELLRGMPVARALLTDLQRAAEAGSSVELIVSPDRQVAEIATASGHYVLTTAARNSVLAALVGRTGAAVAPGAPAPGTDGGVAAREAAASRESSAPLRSVPAPAPGILWESPSVAARERPPAELIALPWLGPAAQLEVQRDGARRGAAAGEEAAVSSAKLRLQLPHLGRFEARIRVCGRTVAVSVACADEGIVGPRLGDLERRLSAQGLAAAHLGIDGGGGGDGPA